MNIDKQLDRLALQERQAPVPKTSVAGMVLQTIRQEQVIELRSFNRFSIGTAVAAALFLVVTMQFFSARDAAAYEPESYVYADLDAEMEQ
jgi:hypothetical protein